MEYVGTSYKGESRDGRFEGNGTYNFSTGTKYIGELKDGMFHGKGTIFFENGGKYEAMWEDGIAIEVFSRYFLRLNNLK